MKRYVIFAGVNGAGKSTLYRTEGIIGIPEERVNSDEILRKRSGDWRSLSDQRKAGEEAIKKIRRNLENYDKDLLVSRDKARYENCGYKSQNIKTIFGIVPYKRHNYYDNKERKYVFLLDEIIGKEIEGNFTANLIERIIDLSTKLSYREVEVELEKLMNLHISHQTIWNIVQKKGSQILTEYKKLDPFNETSDDKIKTDILFEEHDGVLVNSRPKSKYGMEIKVGTFFSGWEEEAKERYRLRDKITFAAAMKSEEFLSIKEKLAYETYDMEGVRHRILNADGAGWTSNVMDERTVVQLDFFHIKQAIYRGIRDMDTINECFRALHSKRYNELMTLIETYRSGIKREGEIKNVDSLLRYLKNNFEQLKRYKDVIDYDGEKELRNMGIQEGQNHMIVSKRMKHKKMSWSYSGATNLAILICDKMNRETGNRKNSQKRKIMIEMKQQKLNNAIRKVEEKISFQRKKENDIEDEVRRKAAMILNSMRNEVT